MNRVRVGTRSIALALSVLIASNATKWNGGAFGGLPYAWTVWSEQRRLMEHIAVPHEDHHEHTESDTEEQVRLTDSEQVVPSTPAVSFVVPFLNEEFLIASVLAELLTLKGQRSIEIVAVDDASVDAGATRAAALSDPDVRVLRTARRAGYETVLRTGVASTSGRWVVTLTPDVAHVWSGELLGKIESLLGSVATGGTLLASLPHPTERPRLRNKLAKWLLEVALGLDSAPLWPGCAVYDGRLIRALAKEKAVTPLHIRAMQAMSFRKRSGVEHGAERV